jgi:integrase
VEATILHLPPPVAALVKLQLLTGARGGELFGLRTCDIDRSRPVWKTQPTKHKTAHHGKKRTIYFGPRAQAVLGPMLKLDLTAALLAPADAHAWRNERLAKRRKTPLTPSQLRRAEAARGRQRQLRPTYDKASYARAIARVCAREGLPHWHPHQLRHTAGTTYRREADFETAKIVLGHGSEIMTQVYAERDERKAEEVVARIG